MSLPAHLRKTGPGTAGRNEKRDAQICTLAAQGLSYAAIGRKVGRSGERIRLIVREATGKADRNARIRAKWRAFERSDKQDGGASKR